MFCANGSIVVNHYTNRATGTLCTIFTYPSDFYFHVTPPPTKRRKVPRISSAFKSVGSRTSSSESVERPLLSLPSDHIRWDGLVSCPRSDLGNGTGT